MCLFSTSAQASYLLRANKADKKSENKKDNEDDDNTQKTKKRGLVSFENGFLAFGIFYFFSFFFHFYWRKVADCIMLVVLEFCKCFSLVGVKQCLKMSTTKNQKCQSRN